MADYESTGNGLKKLIKKARAEPMPFAFCPTSPGGDPIFASHLKKTAEVFAKLVRKDSGQGKVAYGTFTVQGKLMTLTLEKELPAIAKKIKTHLKGEKLTFNVKVLDASGKEVESDVEDLPDADEDDDDDTAAEAAENRDSPATAPETAADPAPAPAPDRESTDGSPGDARALVSKLKELQPGIHALQGPLGDTLRKALASVAGLIKAGQPGRAGETLANIEKAWLRSQTTAPDAPEATEAPQDAPKAKATPEAGQADGPEAADQARRLAELRATAEKVPEPVRTKMLGVLDKAGQQIHSGDVAKAAGTMDPLEKALANFSIPEEKPADMTPAAQAPVEAGDVSEVKADTASPLLAGKWAEAAAKLEPAVLAAISAGKGDSNAIRLKFYSMQDQAEAGNHKAALARVADLTRMLREAQNAPAVNFSEIPADVVPFAKSRLAWANTRALLRSEIGRLKTAMDAALANVEGMEGASGETGRLFSYLDNLDGRLEQALDALASTADGPDRQALKAKARAIIAEYSAELDGDFFRDVDGNNGFAPVKVRGPAVSALQRIGAVLAA